MTDRKIYILNEVMKNEPIEDLAKRLGLTVELIQRLQKLARRVIRKGGK